MYGIFPAQFWQHYYYVVKCNDVVLYQAMLPKLTQFIPSNVFVIMWSILVFEHLLKF